MTIATDFPDYPASELPLIPAHWRDVSWRNDACPSWAVAGLVIYVDYAAPAAREWPDCERFHITLGETGESLFATDNWADVIEFVAAEETADGIDAEAERSRA